MPATRPVRVTHTFLRTVTAAVLLAAVGGAASHRATPDNSRDVAPTTSATQSLQVAPFRQFVSPDGRGGYQTAVEQVGKVVAISDSSLTAASSDGTTKTYLMTPSTTAVSLGSDHNGWASAQFTVNDVVSIVGIVDDGTATATVIAAQAIANGNGPPMDG
jgi:hypothetical protein